MLSCRRVKAPLIFVSVLLHRETNLQVENEETIEAQSARTPKRCWTESNSAFSFVCANLNRWCRRAARRSPRPCPASLSHRPALRRPPVFVRSCQSLAARAQPRPVPFGLTRLACAKRVRYTQLSPTARSGKSVGSSPTSTMQKREYGWMRSAGRWIGARGAVGAARTGSGMHWYFRAAASRPAAGMRAPARVTGGLVAMVVAFASSVPFAFASAFASASAFA